MVVKLVRQDLGFFFPFRGGTEVHLSIRCVLLAYVIAGKGDPARSLFTASQQTAGVGRMLWRTFRCHRTEGQQTATRAEAHGT